MKKAGLTHLFWLTVVAALLAGCGKAAALPTPTPTQPPPTFTPTLPPTDTPTPIPTDTPVPTDTPTPIPTQSITSMAGALRLVLQGVGVADAAAYDPTKPGIHPVFIISSVDQTEWNEGLPETWRPSNIGQTELVAIVQLSNVLIDRHFYKIRGGGVLVIRLRVDTSVSLREAQSGALIAKVFFTGSEPPQFPEELPPYQVISGPVISAATLQTWLAPYVDK